MKAYDFHEIVHSMGETGIQMTQLGAAEGSAGNISVFVREMRGWKESLRQERTVTLPVPAPALADGWLVITASGKRLRDLETHLEGSICLLRICPDGERAALYTAGDLRPTVEWNSHVAVHNDQVARRGLSYHAIVHVQPTYLTYLSHIERYRDPDTLNRLLLRWAFETIAVFPDGIGTIPFHLPGSPGQAEDSIEALRTHKLVIWQRHGTISRSDEGVQNAGDLVEYAETAARYECLNLQAGQPASGFSEEELRGYCQAMGIRQPFF